MADKERPALERAPPDDEDLADHLAGGVRTGRKTPPLKPKSEQTSNAPGQSPRKNP